MQNPLIRVIIEKLPEPLWEAGLTLLEIAKAYRAVGVVAQSEARAAMSVWQAEFDNELRCKRERIKNKLLAPSSSSSSLSSSSYFASSALIDDFHQLKRWIAKSYQEKDEIPSKLPSSYDLNAFLTAFKAETIRLQEQVIKYNSRVPWELSYACERDPGVEQTAAANGGGVTFGGKLVNADGSVLFEDSCCVCSIIIQSGFEFGKDTPRVHCLDCQSNAACCMFCFDVLHSACVWSKRKVIDAKRELLKSTHTMNNISQLDQQDKVIQDKLHSLCPHLCHRTVVELNESVMLRNAVCDKHNDRQGSEILSLPHMMANAFTIFKERPCFGTIRNKSDIRSDLGCFFPLNDEDLSDSNVLPSITAATTIRSTVTEKRDDAVAADFKDKVVQYTTYGFEFNNRITPIAKSLAVLTGLNIQDRVAISFHGSRLFYDVEISVLLRRCTSTNLPEDWSDKDWLVAANRANVSLAFLSRRKFLSLLPAIEKGEVGSLRNIVVIDDSTHNTEDFSAIQSQRVIPMKTIFPRISAELIPSIAVYEFEEFLLLGNMFEGGGRGEGDVVLDGNCNDQTIIFHSSGTTGTPKGVIQDANATIKDFNVPIFTRPIVEFSYLPPVWGTDKLTVWRSVLNGGCVAFAFSSDMSVLFPQISLVQPTTLIMVPTIARTLQIDFTATVENNFSQCAYLFSSKKIESIGSADTKLLSEFMTIHARALALDRISNAIGDRCKLIAIGGAKIPSEVLSFMKAAVPTVVVDTYGTSESSGISTNNKVAPNVRLKLLDRPDLGYTTEDKPFPRGEICVYESINQIKQDQWLCSDAEKEEVLKRYLPDGYFRTGDIGMIPSPGELIVIDRASSLIKLSTGIFVSPEKIEECLIRINGVAQILIAPNDSGTILFGIVILEQDYSGSNSNKAAVVNGAAVNKLTSVGKSDDNNNGNNGNKGILNEESSHSAEWIAKFRAHGVASGLLSHEIPQVVIFEKERWSVSNGSLLPNHKINRRAIRSRHSEQLSRDYIGNVSSSALDQLFQQQSDASLISPFDAVLSVIAQSIGITIEELILDVSLHDQGVDSISYIRVIHSMQEFALRQVERGAMLETPPRLLVAEVAAATPIQLATKWTSRCISAKLGTASSGGVSTTGEINRSNRSTSSISGGGIPLVTASSINNTDLAKDNYALSRNSVDRGIRIEADVVQRISMTSDGINAMIDQLSEEVNRKCSEMYTSTSAAATSSPSSHLPAPGNLETMITSLPPSSSSSATRRNAVFITGSTGYFGKFLVADFLSRNTVDNGNGDVHGNPKKDHTFFHASGFASYETMICLVRGSSLEDAKRRLKCALLSTRKLSEGAIDSAFELRRVEVLLGDITKPFLGLPSINAMHNLSQRLVLILHAAAAVKFYDAANGLPLLVNPNVVGTSEVLVLSKLSAPCVQFMYLGTISCSNPDTNIQTKMGLQIDLRDDYFSKGYKENFHEALDAYSMSKHMAEVLVRKCLPEEHFSIVRLPLLTWSREGVCNREDWLQRLIDNCRLVKLSPSCTQVSSWTTPISYLGVDVCARLVLEISSCRAAASSSAALSAAALLLLSSYVSSRAGPGTIDLASSKCTLTVKSIISYLTIDKPPIHHHAKQDDGSLGIDDATTTLPLNLERLSNAPHSIQRPHEVRDFSFLRSILSSSASLPFSPLAATFLQEITSSGKNGSSKPNNSVIFDASVNSQNENEMQQRDGATCTADKRTGISTTPFGFDLTEEDFRVENNWRTCLQNHLKNP